MDWLTFSFLLFTIYITTYILTIVLFHRQPFSSKRYIKMYGSNILYRMTHWKYKQMLKVPSTQHTGKNSLLYFLAFLSQLCTVKPGNILLIGITKPENKVEWSFLSLYYWLTCLSHGLTGMVCVLVTWTYKSCFLLLYSHIS